MNSLRRHAKIEVQGEKIYVVNNLWHKVKKNIL